MRNLLGGPVVGGSIGKGDRCPWGEEEYDEEGVCLAPELIPASLYLPQPLCSLHRGQAHALALCLSPESCGTSPLLPHDLLLADVLWECY